MGNEWRMGEGSKDQCDEGHEEVWGAIEELVDADLMV